jgi:hypothetical protein
VVDPFQNEGRLLNRFINKILFVQFLFVAPFSLLGLIRLLEEKN